MKRILLRSGKDPFDVLSVEESIERDVLGTNAGNLIFSNASHKILSTPDTQVDSNGLTVFPGLVEKINSEYDAFVVPLANAFRPSFAPALQRLTRVVRQLKVPVVVLGVGAQANAEGDLAALGPLEDSVRDFVSAVLDHGPSIGVRGEFTADYLAGLGFRDVEVIGCPSMFFDGPVLQPVRPVGELSESSRIAVNGAHAAMRSLGLDRIITRIHEQFPETTFIGQNTVEAAQLRWRDVASPAGAVKLMPTHPEHPMFGEGRARVYVDPASWINDLRGFDVSIGARIHGSIAALLAGTPALVLCGDSRTMELCRYFEIPHRMLKSLPEDVDPVALIEEADWSPMTAGHRDRFDTFAAYLDRHGLANTFAHGDGGAAFDDRMASLDFPAGVQPSHLSDLDASREHVAWLREQTRESRRQDQVRLSQELLDRLSPATVASPVRRAARRLARARQRTDRD